MNIPVGSLIAVNEGLITHVGVYLTNREVLHHHWSNGTERISIDKFAKGKPIKIMKIGVENIEAMLRRANLILSKSMPYNWLSNNCEHIASFVREGKSSSPQLNGVLVGGLIVSIFALVGVKK